MIRTTIHDAENRLSVKTLCALAGVSRSGYYYWLKNSCSAARCNKEAQDELDYRLIREAYDFRGYAKGVMGIHMRLLHIGIRMNHKKIRRLMHKFGLVCPLRKANPYRRMAKAMKTNAVADNQLKRRFKSYGARRVFLTDITYIPFGKAFLYLSVILDAYTEQVMSYELSDSLEIDFVLATVEKLIRNHGTSIDATAMIHSDQGCHYTSTSFRKLISDHGLRQSMSRRGNCWDNAPQESFFGHMKDELDIKVRNWQSLQDVQHSIDDWMDYYNNDRYKVGLGKMSPNEFYRYLTTGNYPTMLGQASKNIIPCP